MSFNTYKRHITSPPRESFGQKRRNLALQWFGLLPVAGLAVVQGLALIVWGSKGAAVTLGAAYIYVVFRWPHIAIIIAVVIIFDVMGFLNCETFLRFPGVFMLKDLIFASLFLPLLFNAKWQSRAKHIFHHYWHRGLIGYKTGGILTLVTLGLFTMAGDIVGHSFALGVLL